MIRLVQQMQWRQHRIRQILKQRHLLLALHARRLGYVNHLRRLDTQRLVVHVEFAARFFNDFLALDHRLLADAPILPLLPALHDIKKRGLQRGAQPLNDREPRNAREQINAGREYHQKHQCTAGKSQQLRRRSARDGADHAAGRKRQRRFQTMHPQILNAAACHEQQQEADADHHVRCARCIRRGFNAFEAPCRERTKTCHPPVRGNAKQIQQQIGQVRTDHAACITYAAASAVRPAGIGLAVREQHHQQIKYEGQHRQP